MTLTKQIFINTTPSKCSFVKEYDQKTFKIDLLINKINCWSIEGKASLSLTSGTRYEFTIEKTKLAVGTSLRLGSCSNAFRSSVEINFNSKIPYDELGILRDEILLHIQAAANGVFLTSEYLQTNIKEKLLKV
jgi:hypothetical protein